MALGRRLARSAALLAALGAAPVVARAQTQDVGPVRVVPFAGLRYARGGAFLIGIAGDLKLRRVYSLQAAASKATLGGGDFLEQYEVTFRWTGSDEAAVRPYVGAGVAVTRFGAGSSNVRTTRFAGLGVAGVVAAVAGVDLFAEAVGVYDGALVGELRGGVQLLLWH